MPKNPLGIIRKPAKVVDIRQVKVHGVTEVVKGDSRVIGGKIVRKPIDLVVRNGEEAGEYGEARRAGQLREFMRMQPEQRWANKEYWELFTVEDREARREYWEHFVPQAERVANRKYWLTVPWGEKVNGSGSLRDAYFKFEGQRAEKERLARAGPAENDLADIRKQQIKKLEDELKKPWGQRERNKGLGNKLFWRPFNFVSDIVFLPFAFGSWTAGLLARPLTWFNDKILQAPHYGRASTPLNEGTGLSLRKPSEFMPSLFTERRELNAARRNDWTVSAVGWPRTTVAKAQAIRAEKNKQRKAA
jgi:hypothetical protein